MDQAARRPPPKLCLPVVAVRALVPAAEPVAPPRLVFFEGRSEFSGQRPRRQRITRPAEQGRQWREHRLGHRLRIAEYPPQPPAQHLGIANRFITGAGHVGIQRLAHEFAWRQEAEIRGDAMSFRQRLLQPATHRGLRNQDGVWRQQVAAGQGPRQFRGQYAGEHLQVVAVIEQELVRRQAHVAMMPESPSQPVRPATNRSPVQNRFSPPSSNWMRWRTPGDSISTQ